jgi:succinate dehydrogenase / fumarate reductase membrane anchor subunit
MVTSVTNFSRSGLSDWVLQRVSAVILATYAIFIVGYLLCTPELTFGQWKELFSMTSVRIYTLLAVLALVAHAWVGLWTIATDYIKPALIRFLFNAAVIGTLFVLVVWSIEILWGL